MLVCPHDTASDPDRWYLLVQYLAQKLDTRLNFSIMLDFADFAAHLPTADMVYANPVNTLNLMGEGFAVLARPANLYDEVVFVSNHDIPNPTLDVLEGAQLASVENLLPTKLALHLLKGKGIEPAGILPYDSWTAVIGALWRGEAQYGLVYKDTYDELSEQGKQMVNAFYVSQEKAAFHSFVAGRNALPQKDTIQRILLDMVTDERGIEILHELRIPQWEEVNLDDLGQVKYILETYQVRSCTG